MNNSVNLFPWMVETPTSNFKKDYQRFIAHQVNRNYRRHPADWNRLVRLRIAYEIRQWNDRRDRDNDDNDMVAGGGYCDLLTSSSSDEDGDDDENDGYNHEYPIHGFVPQKGDTFLHLLCSGFPNVIAVQTILEHYSRQFSKKSVVERQNIHGTTPLHVAIACCADHTVIELLLKYHRNHIHHHPNPSLSNDDCTGVSSSSSTTKMSRRRSSLAAIPTKCGKLPLHLACMEHFYSSSMRYIREILILLRNDYPEAILSQDAGGNTPIQLLWKYYYEKPFSNWPTLLSKQLRTYECSNNQYTNDSICANRKYIWENLSVLLTAPYNEKNYNTDGTSIANTHKQEKKTVGSDHLSNNSNISVIKNSTANNNDALDNSNNNINSNNNNNEEEKSINTTTTKISSSSSSNTKNQTSVRNKTDYFNPFSILAQTPSCPPMLMDVALHMIPKESQHLLEIRDRIGSLPIHYAAINQPQKNAHFLQLKIIPMMNDTTSSQHTTTDDASSQENNNDLDRQSNERRVRLGEYKDDRNDGTTEENYHEEHQVTIIPQTVDGFYHFRIDTLLDHIVLAAPKTASMREKKSGRMPLHLALASGKTWNQGVDSIVRAHPESLLSLDPVTKLYPFMLAATSASDRYRSFSNDEAFLPTQANNKTHSTLYQKPMDELCPKKSLDDKTKTDNQILTIFKLLKSSPEVLNCHYVTPQIGTKRKSDYLSNSEKEIQVPIIPKIYTKNSSDQSSMNSPSNINRVQKRRKF